MANPFDLHAVLLAKHAQHVVLIHFPVALFITGVAFDLLSRGNPDSPSTARASRFEHVLPGDPVRAGIEDVIPE